MPVLEAVTDLAAPPQAVLDASLDLDLEQAAGARYGVRAVSGRTTGRIGLGETVTWAVRLGGVVPVRHTSRIVELEPPGWFVDEMERGLFAAFRHEHRFLPRDGGGTRMEDRMAWRSPLGPLGRVADVVLVRPVLARLLADRNAELVRRCGAPGGPPPTP